MEIPNFLVYVGLFCLFFVLEHRAGNWCVDNERRRV